MTMVAMSKSDIESVLKRAKEVHEFLLERVRAVHKARYPKHYDNTTFRWEVNWDGSDSSTWSQEVYGGKIVFHEETFYPDCDSEEGFVAFRLEDLMRDDYIEYILEQDRLEAEAKKKAKDDPVMP
jgi:hypothetical protein